MEGAGRGAIAREDLYVGDTALEIPTSLIISEELVKESDMVWLKCKTVNFQVFSSLCLLLAFLKSFDCIRAWKEIKTIN